MLIICTREEYNTFSNSCDGRCTSEEWCALKNFEKCPLDNDNNFVIAKEKDKEIKFVE